ncbi:MAG: endopeptidase La [Bacilli bacterium]|nr:endopeptidase La [Bacilli bacterium]
MADTKPSTLTLPLLITKGLVVFPKTTKLIDAGRDFSINAIKVAKSKTDSLILITSQKTENIEMPTENDLFPVGVVARITSISERENRIRIRLEVVDRVKLSKIEYDKKDDKCFIADATFLEQVKTSPEESEAVISSFNHEIEKYPTIIQRLPKNLINLLANNDAGLEACYGFLSFFDSSLELKQKMLESNDLIALAESVITLISGENTKEEIEKNISETVRESTEKSQKEYFLREKLKAIKKELGEDVGGSNDPDEILAKLEKFPYPENVKNKVKAEIKKFEMMPQGSLEAALIISYLDVLMSVPWYQKTEDNNDLKNVENILDEDHYGLENPKKRIVEYLAVKKLTGNLKSPILCFYGPPGTGKTSLGKSIARALGRKFFKCSLGGISDEAEIRGHRRTYVGSLPGRIIQGMRKAGVSNPVFLLDEVDKLASSYKGDPASALLEVLDPEQNFMFNDNYLEEPYDLSDVLFICTANYLESIPGPLRDRLELIPLSSYTEVEKKHIAFEHLIKKQIELNGLKESNVTFTEKAIEYILHYYTREAGVRDLERKIASCLRKVAVAIVKDPKIEHIDIDEKQVRKYLGVEIFDYSKKEKEKQVGVITGLAYTEFGGDILPIEVTYFKGKGALVLTGHLGDVMKESATIALDYVKANAEKYHIDPEIFLNNDIHVHVPEGAVPKDGPSAGVALTLAIISATSKKAVSPDIALTGEVTLRGNALAIGGLREKSLAAARSGIKTIIVPDTNKKDVNELPKEVKSQLKILYMKNVDDAYKIVFGEND